MGTGRAFHREERGNATIIGFMVGALVFAVGFYYVAGTAMVRQADTSTADNSNLNAVATSLSDAILRPGVGWYSAYPCQTAAGITKTDQTRFSPEGVSDTSEGTTTGQFGLGEELCVRSATDPAGRNNLSYSKFVNLYGARTEGVADNGRVDYEEARESLALEDESVDFHIRSWPVLANVRQILEHGQKDPYMRALYIGDYLDSSHDVVRWPDHKKGIIDYTDRITIWLNITNNGTSATIFAALFSLPLKRNQMEFGLHTPLLAPGAYYNLTVTVRKSADWDWKDDNEKWIDYEIHDKDGKIMGDRYTLPNSLSMDYLLNQKSIFIEAEKLYYTLAGPTVTGKFHYQAYDGDGQLDDFSDWTLVTTDPLGIPGIPSILNNNVDEGTVDQIATMTGAYKGQIKNDLLTATWNLDVLNIVDSLPGGFTTGWVAEYEPGEAVDDEIRYINYLLDQFDPYVFDEEFDTQTVPYAEGGDVLPDLKDVMNNDLIEMLTDDAGNPSYAQYTTLLVGSNVDHNVMTSASAKYAIRDFVLAGGTLIAFGSDDQSVTWLQPLFHSSLETANGGLLTPDTSHPALTVPNELDYENFDYDTEWSFNSVDADEDPFTHVVTAGSEGDALAVSNAGAFGEGRVLLTSWRPFDLSDDQATRCAEPIEPEDNCEGIFLIHNLITLTYRYLYLDYGPPIPIDRAVGSTLRVVSVYHPELRELVTVQMQIYAFAG